jgi:hypothetical protein
VQNDSIVCLRAGEGSEWVGSESFVALHNDVCFFSLETPRKQTSDAMPAAYAPNYQLPRSRVIPHYQGNAI